MKLVQVMAHYHSPQISPHIRMNEMQADSVQAADEESARNVYYCMMKGGVIGDMISVASSETARDIFRVLAMQVLGQLTRVRDARLVMMREEETRKLECFSLTLLEGARANGCCSAILATEAMFVLLHLGWEPEYRRQLMEHAPPIEQTLIHWMRWVWRHYSFELQTGMQPDWIKLREKTIPFKTHVFIRPCPLRLASRLVMFLANLANSESVTRRLLLDCPAALEFVCAFADHPWFEMKRSSLAALTKLLCGRAQPYLTEVLAKVPDPDVVVRAVCEGLYWENRQEYPNEEEFEECRGSIAKQSFLLLSGLLRDPQWVAAMKAYCDDDNVNRALNYRDCFLIHNVLSGKFGLPCGKCPDEGLIPSEDILNDPEKHTPNTQQILERCGNPACKKLRTRLAGSPRSGFKKCSKCKRVVYCSRACQVTHWKKGGHKDECKKMASR